MSKRSTLQNPDSYFQFFRNILLQIKLDKKDNTLRYNNFPTTVEWRTTIAKMHYVYQMMGVNVVYVRGRNGRIIGELTKTRFLGLRYKTPM